MTNLKTDLQASFTAALPIVLGYVAIGVPCGILCDSIGLNALQVFAMSVLFYSGAGQFMIPNMWLAGAPIASIIASVSFVNTRQMLYSAAFAPHCIGVRKRLAFLFAATVTDESYGVNTLKFEEGDWSVRRALFVNLFSCTSWTLSCTVGVLVGNAIGIPLAIASFAMTSIFICLLCTQKANVENVVAAAVAMLGVRTRDPARCGRGRGRRPVRVPGAPCALSRECGARGSYRGSVRRWGRRRPEGG